MPENVSFSRTFQALERAIDIARQRHNHIAGNISNLDTPDYKPKEIDFRRALARALNSNHGYRLVKTDNKHVDMGMNSSGNIESFEQQCEWDDFNRVEIDKEMTKLMENNLMHRLSVESLLRKIDLLKEVIREGERQHKLNENT
jgi:flagellar basal-body rod protein FlgB